MQELIMVIMLSIIVGFGVLYYFEHVPYNDSRSDDYVQNRIYSWV